MCCFVNSYICFDPDLFFKGNVRGDGVMGEGFGGGDGGGCDGGAG